MFEPAGALGGAVVDAAVCGFAWAGFTAVVVAGGAAITGEGPADLVADGAVGGAGGLFGPLTWGGLPELEPPMTAGGGVCPAFTLLPAPIGAAVFGAAVSGLMALGSGSPLLGAGLCAGGGDCVGAGDCCGDGDCPGFWTLAVVGGSFLKCDGDVFVEQAAIIRPRVMARANFENDLIGRRERCFILENRGKADAGPVGISVEMTPPKCMRR